MLKNTFTNLKKVCTITLLPRIWRGHIIKCGPGKFHKCKCISILFNYDRTRQTISGLKLAGVLHRKTFQGISGALAGGTVTQYHTRLVFRPEFGAICNCVVPSVLASTGNNSKSCDDKKREKCKRIIDYTFGSGEYPVNDIRGFMNLDSELSQIVAPQVHKKAVPAVTPAGIKADEPLASKSVLKADEKTQETPDDASTEILQTTTERLQQILTLKMKSADSGDNNSKLSTTCGTTKTQNTEQQKIEKTNESSVFIDAANKQDINDWNKSADKRALRARKRRSEMANITPGRQGVLNIVKCSNARRAGSKQEDKNEKMRSDAILLKDIEQYGVTHLPKSALKKSHFEKDAIKPHLSKEEKSYPGLARTIEPNESPSKPFLNVEQFRELSLPQTASKPASIAESFVRIDPNILTSHMTDSMFKTNSRSEYGDAQTVSKEKSPTTTSFVHMDSTKMGANKPQGEDNANAKSPRLSNSHNTERETQFIKRTSMHDYPVFPKLPTDRTEHGGIDKKTISKDNLAATTYFVHMDTTKMGADKSQDKYYSNPNISSRLIDSHVTQKDKGEVRATKSVIRTSMHDYPAFLNLITDRIDHGADDVQTVSKGNSPTTSSFLNMDPTKMRADKSQGENNIKKSPRLRVSEGSKSPTNTSVVHTKSTKMVSAKSQNEDNTNRKSPKLSDSHITEKAKRKVKEIRPAIRTSMHDYPAFVNLLSDRIKHRNDKDSETKSTLREHLLDSSKHGKSGPTLPIIKSSTTKTPPVSTKIVELGRYKVQSEQSQKFEKKELRKEKSEMIFKNKRKESVADIVQPTLKSSSAAFNKDNMAQRQDKKITPPLSGDSILDTKEKKVSLSVLRAPAPDKPNEYPRKSVLDDDFVVHMESDMEEGPPATNRHIPPKFELGTELIDTSPQLKPAKPTQMPRNPENEYSYDYGFGNYGPGNEQPSGNPHYSPTNFKPVHPYISSAANAAPILNTQTKESSKTKPTLSENLASHKSGPQIPKYIYDMCQEKTKQADYNSDKEFSFVNESKTGKIKMEPSSTQAETRPVPDDDPIGPVIVQSEPVEKQSIQSEDHVSNQLYIQRPALNWSSYYHNLQQQNIQQQQHYSYEQYTQKFAQNWANFYQKMQQHQEQKSEQNFANYEANSQPQQVTDASPSEKISEGWVNYNQEKEVIEDEQGQVSNQHDIQKPVQNWTNYDPHMQPQQVSDHKSPQKVTQNWSNYNLNMQQWHTMPQNYWKHNMDSHISWYQIPQWLQAQHQWEDNKWARQLQTESEAIPSATELPAAEKQNDTQQQTSPEETKDKNEPTPPAMPPHFHTTSSQPLEIKPLTAGHETIPKVFDAKTSQANPVKKTTYIPKSETVTKSQNIGKAEKPPETTLNMQDSNSITDCYLAPASEKVQMNIPASIGPLPTFGCEQEMPLSVLLRTIQLKNKLETYRAFIDSVQAEHTAQMSKCPPSPPPCPPPPPKCPKKIECPPPKKVECPPPEKADPCPPKPKCPPPCPPPPKCPQPKKNPCAKCIGTSDFSLTLRDVIPQRSVLQSLSGIVLTVKDYGLSRGKQISLGLLTKSPEMKEDKMDLGENVSYTRDLDQDPDVPVDSEIQRLLVFPKGNVAKRKKGDLPPSHETLDVDTI